MRTREQVNALQYGGDESGHYESFFQRANHPTRPLAFWIRYTLFSPKGRAGDAIGQLWAVYFDGERGETHAVKQGFPLGQCEFDPTRLAVRVADATLDESSLVGTATSSGTVMGWKLRYSSPEPPLLLLPDRMYRGGFPKAKALVGSPLAVFNGQLEVGDEAIDIDDWVGSQNHNWGSKHTDRYAWAQVAGFDNDPRAFLECATASIRIGPLYTPKVSPLVLRLGDEEIRLNGLRQSLRASARYGFFDWRLRSASRGTRVEVKIHAPSTSFVALPYENPPGGIKTCLNSKLAACELVLERPRHAPLRLHTQSRAAFEILTDSVSHGVPLLRP